MIFKQKMHLCAKYKKQKNKIPFFYEFSTPIFQSLQNERAPPGTDELLYRIHQKVRLAPRFPTGTKLELINLFKPVYSRQT